jgi:hypothetical protein
MAEPALINPAETAVSSQTRDHGGNNAAALRLTEAQRRYLERGLTEPGGKLPLFDREGRDVPRKTVDACLAHGWAERWIANPIKPDWPVCRLTDDGYRVLGRERPGRSDSSPRAPEVPG